MATNPVAPNLNTTPRTVQYPTSDPITGNPHVVQFPSPAEMDDESFHAAARRSLDFLKSASQSFIGAFGLPSNSEDVAAANKQIGQQLAHPIQTAEDIAAATGKGIVGMLPATNNAILKKSQAAYQSGDHVTAARHLVDYLLPLVGGAADTAGDQAQAGRYGSSAGTVAGTVLPMLLGKLFGAPAPEAESAPVEAEPTAVPEQTPVQSEPVAKPVAVKAAPMSPEQATAAAYLRRTRAQAPAVEVPTNVPKVAPLSELDRTAQGFLTRNKLEAPQVEVLGAKPTEVATKVAGETTRVKQPVAGVVSDAEAQSLATQELNRITKQKIEAARPENALAAVKQRLGLSQKEQPAGMQGEAVTALKSKLAAKAKADAATLESHVTGDPDILSKHTVVASDVDGKLIGSLRMTEEPNTGIVRVDNASSDLPKGSGLGVKMYKRAISEAQARGVKTFTSDGVVSNDAASVYRKLRDMGYPVTESEGKGGSTFSIDLSKLPKSGKVDIKAAMDYQPPKIATPTAGQPEPFMKSVYDLVSKPKSIDLTDEMNAHQ